MKKISLFILILLLYNCNNHKKVPINEKEITDEFKLDFLNQILSDTTENRILLNSTDLISNYPDVVPPFLPKDSIDSTQSISLYQYISDTLKIDDVNFVEKQFKKNMDFDLTKLEDKGFSIIDVKGYIKKGISWDSIQKIADNYYDKNDLDGFIIYYLTQPIFNKELSLAYIRVKKISGGASRIYENMDGSWKLKYEFDHWIE